MLDSITDLPDDDPIEYVRYADSEICNGGFFQYYSNAIFDAQQHVALLRQLDRKDLADIVEQSINVFPEGLQPVRTQNDFGPISDKVLGLIGIESKFDSLEREYYNLCPNLEITFANWIRKNSEHYWALIQK